MQLFLVAVQIRIANSVSTKFNDNRHEHYLKALLKATFNLFSYSGIRKASHDQVLYAVRVFHTFRIYCRLEGHPDTDSRMFTKGDARRHAEELIHREAFRLRQRERDQAAWHKAQPSYVCMSTNSPSLRSSSLLP